MSRNLAWTNCIFPFTSRRYRPQLASSQRKALILPAGRLGIPGTASSIRLQIVRDSASPASKAGAYPSDTGARNEARRSRRKTAKETVEQNRRTLIEGPLGNDNHLSNRSGRAIQYIRLADDSEAVFDTRFSREERLQSPCPHKLRSIQLFHKSVCTAREQTTFQTGITTEIIETQCQRVFPCV